MQYGGGRRQFFLHTPEADDLYAVKRAGQKREPCAACNRKEYCAIHWIQRERENERAAAGGKEDKRNQGICGKIQYKINHKAAPCAYFRKDCTMFSTPSTKTAKNQSTAQTT